MRIPLDGERRVVIERLLRTSRRNLFELNEPPDDPASPATGLKPRSLT